MEKKEKIKNENYKRFMKEGIIILFTMQDIEKALQNIKGKYLKEGRSLLICMYSTGARPNEILRIKAKDITREGNNIHIKLLGSKNGLSRELIISLKKLPIIKELYDFAAASFPDLVLFSHFISHYKRTRVTKKGQIKEYLETTDSLRYHIYKWFQGIIPGSIPPYYLRHNRFSKMISKGASLEQIRLTKGSKTVESVYPYIHMSKEIAEKGSKFID